MNDGQQSLGGQQPMPSGVSSGGGLNGSGVIANGAETQPMSLQADAFQQPASSQPMPQAQSGQAAVQQSGQPVVDINGAMRTAARRPTGQRPIAAQQIVPMQHPVVSSGTGDIVLSNGNNGGGKRKGLIAAIAVITVMLVAVIVLAVVANGGTGSGSTGKSDGSLSGSFEEYANLLLYGESSATPIGDYNGPLYQYYFDSYDLAFVDSEEENDAVIRYYSDLATKISDFREKASSSDLSDAIKSNALDYAATALAFTEIKQIYFLDSEFIRNYYTEHGYEATSAYVAEHYSRLVNSEYPDAATMGTALVNIAVYALDEFSAYSTAGCVNGLEINFTCEQEISFARNGGNIELENATTTIWENIRTKVLEGCWEVYNEIV